jgi:hypothetical protein
MTQKNARSIPAQTPKGALLNCLSIQSPSAVSAKKVVAIKPLPPTTRVKSLVSTDFFLVFYVKIVIRFG